MAVRVLAARRVGVHRANRVGAAGRAGRKHDVLDVELHFNESGRVGIRLFVFQRPLMLGAVDLAKAVDAGVFLGRIAGADEVRDRNDGQQTDDGDHDHDFHKREAGLV